MARKNTRKPKSKKRALPPGCCHCCDTDGWPPRYVDPEKIPPHKRHYCNAKKQFDWLLEEAKRILRRRRAQRRYTRR